MGMKSFFKQLAIFLGLASLSIAALLGYFKYKGVEPLFTDSLSFDFKVNQIIKQDFEQVDVLAQGSSICFNNLHSATLIEHLGEDYSFYNFAAFGLTMDHNLTALKVYLPKYRPKIVLMVSGPTDFEETKMELCTEQELRSYLFPGTKPYFYLRRLDFFKLMTRYQRTKERVNNAERDILGNLNLDAGGGVSCAIPPENRIKDRWDDEIYSPVVDYQYENLDKICKLVQAHNAQLIFVQPPMKYGNCQTEYCQEGLKKHFQRSEEIIRANGQLYLNLFENNPYPDSLFFDELHLNYEGPALFTQQMVQELDVRQQVVEAYAREQAAVGSRQSAANGGQ
jgi:hypothetical protein